MTHNPYLDAVYNSRCDYSIPSGDIISVPNHKEHLSAFSAPLQATEEEPSSIQVTDHQHTSHYSAHNGACNNPTSILPADNIAPCEPLYDDPYHVPNYFDLTESAIDPKNEIKLEFDPPLAHYAELRGCLPIGYVWLPPSSPEPMSRSVTPEPEPAFVTPQRPARRGSNDRRCKRSGELAGLLQKMKVEKVGVERSRARFTSPLSELSDVPSGLLTESEELSDAPRGLLTSEESGSEMSE